jgi:hypothetical protein
MRENNGYRTKHTFSSFHKEQTYTRHYITEKIPLGVKQQSLNLFLSQNVYIVTLIVYLMKA